MKPKMWLYFLFIDIIGTRQVWSKVVVMSNKGFSALIVIYALCFLGCTTAQMPETAVRMEADLKTDTITKLKNSGRVIHVLVALCDNENQGIVPVPAHLGNGESPSTNLYWGASLGVRSFFLKSKNWQKLGEVQNPKPNVLERIVFKHKAENVYLVADAYRGSKMRETIDDFFLSASGNQFENIQLDDVRMQIMGGADLIAFVGHDGLMDFKLTSTFKKHDDEKRDAIILACASWNYFSEHLKKTGAEPLLWTSNLMAPEAYTLHDAIEGWIKNENPQQIRIRAATAYAKYQKISQRSAQNLLVTGW